MVPPSFFQGNALRLKKRVLDPRRRPFYLRAMERIVPSYRTRLDWTSSLLIFSLALLPLVLGYALAGIELALVFLALVIALGLWRARGKTDLPGTFALSWHEAPGLFTLIESLARRA